MAALTTSLGVGCARSHTASPPGPDKKAPEPVSDLFSGIIKRPQGAVWLKMHQGCALFLTLRRNYPTGVVVLVKIRKLTLHLGIS